MKHRSWLFFPLVLILSSCTFLSPSGGDDPYGATVEMTPQVARVSSGDQDILRGTLYLLGTDLRVNEPTCRVVSSHLECALPVLPPKKTYVLPVAGKNVVAEARVLRANGEFWARRIGGEK